MPGSYRKPRWKSANSGFPSAVTGDRSATSVGVQRSRSRIQKFAERLLQKCGWWRLQSEPGSPGSAIHAKIVPQVIQVTNLEKNHAVWRVAQ